MRLFFMSNSMGRGYGYSRNYGTLAQELARKGHDVIYFGMHENCPPWRDEDGILRLGVRYASYGGDIIGFYLRSYKPDIFISGVDLWMDDIQYLPKAVHQEGIPWIAGATLNSEPLGHRVYETIRYATVIVSPSRFGVDLLAKEGLNGVYIPHGLDLDVFKPTKVENADDVFALRKPKYCCLSVFRNKGFQKAPWILMWAWQELLTKYPEYAKDAVLLMLTDPKEPGGFDTLLELRERLGLEDHIQFIWARPSDDTLIPTFEGDARGMPHNANIGFSPEVMAQLYNIADVHVLSSLCESFSLPTAEALACGTPCIAPNYAALPELIDVGEPRPRGLLVDIESRWMLPTVEELHIPSSADMAEKIHLMLSDGKFRKKCSKRGTGFAKRFSWNKIVPQWEKLIDSVYEGWYMTPSYNRRILGI